MGAPSPHKNISALPRQGLSDSALLTSPHPGGEALLPPWTASVWSRFYFPPFALLLTPQGSPGVQAAPSRPGSPLTATLHSTTSSLYSAHLTRPCPSRNCPVVFISH